MNYRDALHIGSKAEGIIKCTFATIYNTEGLPLFSVQRVAAEKGIVYKNGYTAENQNTITAKDITIITLRDGLYWVDGESRYGGADARITVDAPIVSVTSISNDKLVPAKIFADAAEYIADTIKNKTRKVYKFTIWAYPEEANTPAGKSPYIVRVQYVAPTETELLATSKKLKAELKVTVEETLNPRWAELLDIIKKNKNVLVKPLAFEWYPTDMKEATIVDEYGNSISLTEYLKRKKSNLDKAKALIAAAGAATIL